MNRVLVEKDLGNRKLSIETGYVAKQADGSVLVRYGDTVVLAAVMASKEASEGRDFLPLTVDYREKAYAAGRIPGGFFKREGRPTEREILACRLIDRPLRPLFPEGYFYETQVLTTVLSADQQNNPDVLAIIGSSAALTLSDIPFNGPVGAVRVGWKKNQFLINPVSEQLQECELNLVVAGTYTSVVMVEGGGNEVPEDILLEAINLGHQSIKEIISLQLELQRLGKTKRVIENKAPDPGLVERVSEFSRDRIRENLVAPSKFERQSRMDEIYQQVYELFAAEDESLQMQVQAIVENIEKEEMRKLISQKGLRADGRHLDQIRPIACEISVLPRTHGSAIFTRGETQALVITTLGTAEDEQRLDDLEGKTSKSFMLHYNFPSFSVGEIKPIRGPGRREIGHGALAERSIQAVLPSSDIFPYTIRIVSDILESNGSSSMATVCGASLCLMDAGVPITAPVAGIAMGLIKEGEDIFILSDILGLEDHLGGMDFKVAGTRKGITGFQMDIKVEGITEEILKRALEKAREGRLYILDKMAETIDKPKPELSSYAPRIVTIKIKSDKVREVIGPGGKVIRGIIEQTGVTIDIQDDGTVSIVSVDEAAAAKAIEIIKYITQEAEIGKIYKGKVKKIVDFGAFVEIFPGTEGLVHISQISHRRVKNISEELNEGDETLVKVMDIDKQGRIRLSRKEALEERS